MEEGLAGPWHRLGSQVGASYLWIEGLWQKQSPGRAAGLETHSWHRDSQRMGLGVSLIHKGSRRLLKEVATELGFGE